MKKIMSIEWIKLNKCSKTFRVQTIYNFDLNQYSGQEVLKYLNLNIIKSCPMIEKMIRDSQLALLKQN
jgi:hypothetical protein